MPEVDAVILFTSWDNHLNIAIEAMEAGKYVGCEVGGAYSVQECWKIVETYERTHVPVMLMENCVYGRDEMMVSNMAESFTARAAISTTSATRLLSEERTVITVWTTISTEIPRTTRPMSWDPSQKFSTSTAETAC